jgi:glycosyltransferase involved in cell wall biosynthesis
MDLSVIIPVRNGGDDLRCCLEALWTSVRVPDEIIVVDDASTDGSIETATQFGALVLSQGDVPLGPAKARNRGAAIARGDILVFIDADVLVHSNTLATIEHYFAAHDEIAALFGSYDATPRHRSLVSLYKNLQHHYVHHHSQRDASTFWTGVGAIRRDVFIALSGFNENYTRPSIEDIELGFRLRLSGYKIWLCPDIQAKHLKQWKITDLLRSDIFDRAAPWTRLILSTAKLPSELNLDHRTRLSTLLVWAFLLHLIAGFWFQIAWAGAALFIGLLVRINFSLYRFFFTENGLWFALGAFALHALYLTYSSLTFAAVGVEHIFSQAFRSIVGKTPSDGTARGFFYE